MPHPFDHTHCCFAPLGQVLLESFENSKKSLQDLAEKNKRRVDKLGHVCLKQEKEHAARIGELDGLYSVSWGVCLKFVVFRLN